ncbi:tetratricopeptide repeat protein [uncultured Kordia sp.]|uniref:tetratricopeptide repeat protein n=1 Tax=uncultured Kordia sp. TaxID=507699 RepID=UPI0026315C28|nr:tetratricopeptide repeat protein [uncultured Kordia sp.]
MKNILSLCIFIAIITKVEAQSSTLAVADSLYTFGNYSKAIKAYQQQETSAYTNTQIAKAYKALGNSKKAIESYEKVLKIDAENALVLYDYGRLLFTAGKLEKSLVIFEKLKAKDTLNPNFHYQIGLAKEALRQETYIQSYQTAFELDAQHQKSIYKLIKNYIETKEFKKADRIITVGLTNNEDDVKVIGFKAQLHYANQEYRKALLWFEKLIDQNKATRYVYEKAAFAAYRVGRILKSIAYYEEALKRDRGNYFYHSQLAKLYYQDGVPDKAEHHASQAIVGKMTDPSGDYYILGMVHFDRKEHKKAMKLFNMALEENPDYELAQLRLAQVADNYYSDSKAKLKMYERFLEKFPKAKIEMKKIVNTRIRELKEEIHLKSE